MKSMETIEALTVVGFGVTLMLFTIGELIVTWRRELRCQRCQRR